MGATNVARIVGRKAGLITLAIDCGKGLLPVWLADVYLHNPRVLAILTIALVAGHCLSLPRLLRGGKGVATALGAFLYLCPIATLFGLAVFLATFAALRIVSAASITAALTIPIYALITAQADTVVIPLAVVALLVVYRHKNNIRRLIQGQEERFLLAGNRN